MLVSWVVLTGGESISEEVNIEPIDTFILHKFILSASCVSVSVTAASYAETQIVKVLAPKYIQPRRQIAPEQKWHS